MKILCISDWETGAFEVPETIDKDISLIISLGDVYRPVLRKFSEFNLPIIGIHGNKDTPGFPEYVTDVHLKPKEFNGIVFGGCQGVWQYKPAGHFLYSDEEIKEILEFLPRVDVFITHNPPKGDTEIDDMVHNGFKSFNDYMKEHRPAYHLHGHIHKNKEFKIEKTKVISVFGMRELEITRHEAAGKDS